MATSVMQLRRSVMQNLSIGLFALFASVVQASEGQIAIFQPQGNAFAEISQAIDEDMSEDLDIHIEVLPDQVTSDSIYQVINQVNPDAIVLLGNSAVNAYIALQQEKGAQNLPPAVVTSALFVEQSMQKLKNAIAIAYEVPLVTSIVGARNALASPVQKVGLIYREQLSATIKEQVAYCEAEGITLVTEALPDHSINMDKKISKAIKRLIRQDVDAYLILNDNGLLTAKTVKKAWIPVLAKQKRPVIVGIDSLFANELNLGAFVIAPDHYGLGQQTASYLWELLDNDWQVEEEMVVQPLSVKKKINVNVINRKRLPLLDDALGSFDQVID